MYRNTLIALLTVQAFAAKPLPVLTATLVDFREERYTEPWITDSRSMHSCVNRDYTIDTGPYVAVLRQSTCYPNRDAAMGGVIGQAIQFQQDGKGRVALLDARGKAHWFKLFKVSQKP